MAKGPGLTGDKNFQHSCEVYLKGQDYRKTIYGKTREEVLADLPFLHNALNYGLTDICLGKDWEDDVVVTATRTVPMGLGPMWARATRRYDEYGERV